MRVAIVATHPVQYQAPWFRALVGAGVDLHVVFAHMPTSGQQATGFGGAFAWDVPLLEGYSWSVLQQTKRDADLGRFRGLHSSAMGRTLAELAPDVVLVTGWNALPLLQGLRAAIQLGIPTVVRGDSNCLQPRAAWKRTGHRALLAAFDAFVSVGSANRLFYEMNGVPPDRIFDGGHFVDNAFFLEAANREASRRAEWRSLWHIPETACCFLFAGKLQEKKRPTDFLHALTRAGRELGPGAVYGLVVGSGEQASELESVVAQEKAPATFAGFLNQTQIGRAYAAADVLVLPSGWGETWGLVVNEAMLFGRPALVSDRVGCGPDLVKDGETGFVFPYSDVEAIATRMIMLARSPRERERMGYEALRTVADYSPERGARATLEAARFAAGII